MGAFREVEPRIFDSAPKHGGTGSDRERLKVRAVISTHRFEVSLRAALLVTTVLIAMTVFLPESITALRAAIGR